MKFITARELRGASAKLWEILPKEEEVVVTLNGKPVALITPLSDTNFDLSLREIRRARAMTAIASMHKDAEKSGASKLTMEEIDAEIRAARKTRKS